MDNQPNQRIVQEEVTIYVTLLKEGVESEVEVMAHQGSSWCDDLELSVESCLLVKYGHKWVQVQAKAKILDTLHKTYFAATRIIPRVHHVELIVCQSDEEALEKREKLIDSDLTEATAYYTIDDTFITIGAPQGVTSLVRKNRKIQVKQVDNHPYLSCDVENITQLPLGLVLKSTNGWNERTRTLVVLSCQTSFDLHIPLQVEGHYQHWQPMAILGKYWLPVNPVQSRNNAQMTFVLQENQDYVLVPLPRFPFESSDLEIPTWPMDVLTDFDYRGTDKDIFCLASKGGRHKWEYVRKANNPVMVAPIEWDVTHFLYQGPPMRIGTPCSISRGLPLCTTKFVEFLDKNASSSNLWENIKDMDSNFCKKIHFCLYGAEQDSKWYVVKRKDDDGDGEVWSVIGFINPDGGRLLGN